MMIRIVLGVFLLIVAGWAQEETPVFKSGTSLAFVRFHVINKNRYVDQLKPEDLVLLEDKTPRQITFFEGGPVSKRTIPMEVLLVFDISGSVTHDGLLDMVQYRDALLSASPALQISIYGFNSKLLKFSGPTRDPQMLEQALERVKNHKAGVVPRPKVIPLELPAKRKGSGGSWVLEAALGAALDAAQGPANISRIVLMFSDGISTTDSRPNDIAPALNEMGVSVNSVVLGFGKVREQIQQAENAGRNKRGEMSVGAQERLGKLQMKQQQIQDFAELAELTGGRSFDPPVFTPQTVPTLLRAIAAQVQFEYVVGFAPESGGDKAKKHKLRVELANKSLGKLTGGNRSLVY